jgi:lysozyme family protein
MGDRQIIDEIIRREGGSAFTNDPVDRGGATKYGITQRAWDDYLRKWQQHTTDRLPREVQSLKHHHAVGFYRSEHVTPMLWIEDTDLRHLVIDCAVNHGPGRARRWLQEAAGVKVDGLIGPVTRGAVNDQPDVAYRNMLHLRIAFFGSIVVNDPTQLRFLRGWLNRACEFIR